MRTTLTTSFCIQGLRGAWSGQGKARTRATCHSSLRARAIKDNPFTRKPEPKAPVPPGHTLSHYPTQSPRSVSSGTGAPGVSQAQDTREGKDWLCRGPVLMMEACPHCPPCSLLWGPVVSRWSQWPPELDVGLLKSWGPQPWAPPLC